MLLLFIIGTFLTLMTIDAGEGYSGESWSRNYCAGVPGASHFGIPILLPATNY